MKTITHFVFCIVLTCESFFVTSTGFRSFSTGFGAEPPCCNLFCFILFKMAMLFALIIDLNGAVPFSFPEVATFSVPWLNFIAFARLSFWSIRTRFLGFLFFVNSKLKVSFSCWSFFSFSCVCDDSEDEVGELGMF